jgi:hypothetical protein
MVTSRGETVLSTEYASGVAITLVDYIVGDCRCRLVLASARGRFIHGMGVNGFSDLS